MWPFFPQKWLLILNVYSIVENLIRVIWLYPGNNKSEPWGRLRGKRDCTLHIFKAPLVIPTRIENHQNKYSYSLSQTLPPQLLICPIFEFGAITDLLLIIIRTLDCYRGTVVTFWKLMRLSGLYKNQLILSIERRNQVFKR